MPCRVEGLRLAAAGRALLDGIDLVLEPGGITMVMGPNGAGKSLLLRALHGLVTPDAGRITWGGEPAGEATRRRQALVFQKPVLLRRSVAANIDFALAARGRPDRARRDALLDHVGLADRARQPARLLSGGEQQRLALARALATEPDVLMLDEPTASLDPASVQAIERIVLAASMAGTKVLFVTHDIGQARRLAGDVVFLHAGRVAEHTGAERFLDAPRSAAGRAYLDGRLIL
ncbi:MAG: ATP-binding cassette domain-containing protein [Pseudomonadota bacterium]